MKPTYTLLLVSLICTSLSSCSKDEEETANSKEVSAKPQLASEQTGELTDQDKLSHGEETHRVHCYKCHTDEIYTRDNRFVKSIDALSKQVVRCKDGNNIAWFDEDTEAVVQFLNNKYYRF